MATDDTLYTGFGFEGINETARNEFMKRTLTHLGVLDAPAPPAGGNTGQVEVGGTVPPRRRPDRRGQHQVQAREREDQVEQEPEGGPQGPRDGSRQLHR